jgi:hypothetical protein
MSDDRFETLASGLSAPAAASAAIVPSDTAPLPSIPRAIYVGTGGDLVMRGKLDDADLTWRNVPSGALLPFRAGWVRASGTSAADLVALF